MLALVAIVCSTVAPAPFASAAAAQTATPGLTLSGMSGTLTRGGQFGGSITITRLTNRAGTLVADGVVSGSTIPTGGLEGPRLPSPESTAPQTATSVPIAVYPSTPTFDPASTSTLTPEAPPTFEPTFALTSTASVTPTLTTAPVTVADAVTAAALADPGAQATAVMQSFREIPLTLTDPDGGACDTLSVDLDPVFVDQPGAQLDLAPATLDLGTLPRANRPVGNLLCAVANLIEASPAGSQAALLNELLPVVNRALVGTAR